MRMATFWPILYYGKQWRHTPAIVYISHTCIRVCMVVYLVYLYYVTYVLLATCLQVLPKQTQPTDKGLFCIDYIHVGTTCHQETAWGENVKSIRLTLSFDGFGALFGPIPDRLIRPPLPGGIPLYVQWNLGIWDTKGTVKNCPEIWGGLISQVHFPVLVSPKD